LAPCWSRCFGALLRQWAERRRSLAFDTDGIVIKVGHIAAPRARGDQQFRGGRSLSSSSRAETTLLRKIEVNVGRTGAVTPFAVLEPGLLAGSTISMTLHNADDLAREHPAKATG
jgi:DNA ligase (NAD+)